MRWVRGVAGAGLVGALVLGGAVGGGAASPSAAAAGVGPGTAAGPTGPPAPGDEQVGAKAEETGVGGDEVAYGWPLRPTPQVTRRFEEPPFRYGRGHRGADLRGVPGQVVVAARAGEVVFAGPVAGRGVVSVRHPDGLRTTYEPVRATVQVGVRVALGDPIGVLEPGHPACPAEACLHWGLRRGSGSAADYLDPLVLLRPRFVRLLPLP